MDKRKLSFTTGIALAGSLVFVSLFSGGGGEPVAGSYVGGYYASGVNCSYQGSGGSVAEVETLTVLFTTDPSSVINPHSEYADLVANADVVYDLSDDSGFSYCMIDEANSYGTPVASEGQYWYELSANVGTLASNRWKVNATGKRLFLERLPFEDVIPAGSQILYAKFKRLMGTSEYVGHTDSLVSVLMTKSTDNIWWQSKKVRASADTLWNYSHATWDVPTAGLDTYGYPKDDVGTWTPSWDDRIKFFDIGDHSDFTGFYNGQGPFSNYDEVDQDITNCVQAIVNGATNNGIATMYTETNTNSGLFSYIHWEPVSTVAGKFSFAVVKYITRPYSAPFPDGKECAFVLTLDDGRQPFNSDMIDATLQRGHTLSTFVIGKEFVGYTGTDYVNIDSLVAWADKGIDVGTHSVWHHSSKGNYWNYPDTTGGLAYYNFDVAGSTVQNEYVDGMWPDSFTAAATAWDSLLFDASPEFFHHAADSLDGNRRDGHLYFGKTIGMPVDAHTQYVVKAVAHHGYDAMRSLGASDKEDDDGYYWDSKDATWFPVPSDTASVWGPPNNVLKPRNMLLATYNESTQGVFGDDTTATMADIKALVRNLVHTYKAKHMPVFATLAHELKNDDYEAANGSRHFYGDYGVSPQEWIWAMEELEDLNVWITNFGDLQRYLKQYATPVRTPDAYAQPDSFKFRADEGIWYVPDGKDNRFIRGIKNTAIEEIEISWSLPVYGSSGTYGFDDEALDAADIAALAEFDYFKFPHRYLLSTDYQGVVSDVRAINPDFIPLVYVWAYGAREEWGDGTPGTFYRDLYDMAENNSDGYTGVPGGTDGVIDMWLYRVDGTQAVHTESAVGAPNFLWNPLFPGYADTLANRYIDMIDANDNLLPFVGVWVDWLYGNGFPGGWVFSAPVGAGDATRDSLDMDEDGVMYGSDPDEQAAYTQVVKDFAAAFRKAAGDSTFLVVPNGNAGRRHETASYFDGGNEEEFQIGYPSNSIANMDYFINTVPGYHTANRLPYHLFMWHPGQTTTLGETSELLGAMSLGTATYHNSLAVPTLPTTKLGLTKRISFATWSGDTVSCDFVNAAGDTVTARIAWVEATGSNTLPWPFIAITADGDTLRRGGGWPQETP